MYQGRLEYGDQALATYCDNAVTSLMVRLQVVLQDARTGTRAIILDDQNQVVACYRKACVE